MKKAFVIFVASLVAFISTQAQAPGDSAIQTFLPAAFNKLVVDLGTTVVLKESAQPAVVIKGDAKFVRSFQITQQGNTLTVSSNYEGAEIASDTITIFVKQLKQLVVLRNANITTGNTLQSSKLKVFLFSEAKLFIRNIGQVLIDGNDDFDWALTR